MNVAEILSRSGRLTKSLHCAVLGAMCMWCPAFDAFAQQALEEIVVTATKREESLQDIPISVSAFSSDMIERLDFGLSYDIAAHVPNLQFMAESSPSTPFIFLRGIGNTSFFPNSINPVATYVDNSYIGQNIAQGLQIYDLERVEVLRGPQGTLFGRNSTAGLVNFITRKPRVEDGVNGRLEVTVGDYGQLDLQAAGGMPVGDRAAVRFAAARLSNSGMYDHVRPGLPDEDFGSVDINSFAASCSGCPLTASRSCSRRTTARMNPRRRARSRATWSAPLGCRTARQERFPAPCSMAAATRSASGRLWMGTFTTCSSPIRRGRT